MLSEDVRHVVMKVSHVYRRICVREIRVEVTDQDIKDAVEVLCMLEKEFPLMFMDIMLHLLIHLVQELYV